MKKVLKRSLISFLFLLFAFTALFGVLKNVTFTSVNADDGSNALSSEEAVATPAYYERASDCIYLSALDYITENNWSYNGWSGHYIQNDKNQDGGTLSLIVDGERRNYGKGVSIHAKGQATYDISDISNDYPRFTAKIGVDASRGTNGSIKFIISVSDDGETWTEMLKTQNVMTGATPAVDVDINVQGKTYLRIYVDPNGSNAADHGTIANAKFVLADYVASDVFYDKIMRLDQYDEILRTKDAEYNYTYNYRSILEREFVNKFGYWNIQYLVELNPDLTKTLDWILCDGVNDAEIKNRILEEVIEVGEISKPTVFLEALTNLYLNFRADLETENGYVYEKMMIGLAAAYSTDTIASPLNYKHLLPNYDYLVRYQLVKQLFEEDKFLHPDWFKEFHVEFMRSIMQDALRADETLWFSNYVRVIKKWATGPYSYMGYVKGNFILPAYFEEQNRELFDKKFHLSEFDVPYGDSPTARYWMVFQHGGICWNLARTGQSVQKTIGMPSAGLFQPSHEAFLLYTKDKKGQGFWYIGNNNHGWGKSSTAWYGTMNYRLLFNWGRKPFAHYSTTTAVCGTNSGYQYLAQANLNRYDDFKKSIYLNLVANSYTDNHDKIAAYEAALAVDELNLDSYDYLIRTYKETEGITAADWKELADRIIEEYTYYPQAMYDLLEVIKPYLTGHEGADLVDTNIKEKAALERASHVTNDEFWQDVAARELANAHLGKVQANIASFSFDGENAGKIIIDPAYDDYDFVWDYRIDGGTTAPTVRRITEHSHQLSPEEIAQITAENDIHIFIEGMSQSQPSYTIRIDEGVLPANLYANDWENRVIGVNLTFEWRNDENDAWTSYAVASPNNTGDKTLYVRVGATGNRTPSTTQMFTFTADNQPLTRKYVAVSHLSVEEYSSQSIDPKRPFYAPNAIDGNANTLWHTDFRVDAVDPYIMIKLDKPRYISALEFKQTKYKVNNPDGIRTAIVFVSADKENWTEAGRIENCADDQKLKTVEFAERILGQYVKIEMQQYTTFVSLALINIYQDLTDDPRPTAAVGYSTTKLTNQDVVARLVSVTADDYEILSDGGDTHVFKENGTFTFRFRDKVTGYDGSAVAVVDWIDKVPPKATIEYSTRSTTKHPVIATLKPDKEVVVTNNGEYEIGDNGEVLDKEGNVLEGFTADEEGNVLDADGNYVANINQFTYEFLDNGTFTFEFVDAAGNEGSATAEVNWINLKAPNALVTTDVKELTNKDVVVTIMFERDDVTVTNNNGSLTYVFRENGEFTFEFVDSEGNKGSEKIIVDWIDKTPPAAKVEYDKSSNKVAVVRLYDFSEEVFFTDGDGTYKFTANGTYTIEFFDKAGNKGSVEVTIDWLKTGGNKTGIVVGCVVAAVVVAGGACVATFFFLKKRKMG